MANRTFHVKAGDTFTIISENSTVRMWVDHTGTVWKLPACVGKLNCSKIPMHGALREFVLWRDKVCQWCGSSEDLVADHIVSHRNGGAHHPGNLQALCQRCNSRKSALVDSMLIRLVDRRPTKCDSSAHGPIQGRIRAIPRASAQNLHTAAQMPDVRKHRVVNQWPSCDASIQRRIGSCLHGRRRRYASYHHDLRKLFFLLPVCVATNLESGLQWLTRTSLLQRLAMWPEKKRSSIKGSSCPSTWRYAT